MIREYEILIRATQILGAYLNLNKNHWKSKTIQSNITTSKMLKNKLLKFEVIEGACFKGTLVLRARS